MTYSDPTSSIAFRHSSPNILFRLSCLLYRDTVGRPWLIAAFRPFRLYRQMSAISQSRFLFLLSPASQPRPTSVPLLPYFTSIACNKCNRLNVLYIPRTTAPILLPFQPGTAPHLTSYGKSRTGFPC
ncbi:unnamed protein product [Tuber aestivum]|uniref:Uncharacterized protein n=1 Tax=Tuber aestivum TaxID=59557 RepID=A0A292Q946_9PEZI|nr:unnamed protein product [Tuber aestivum]